VNPYVYPKGADDPEILSIKRATAEPIFLQEYGASFAAFAGQIYPEFNEQIHVRRCEFNPDWPELHQLGLRLHQPAGRRRVPGRPVSIGSGCGGSTTKPR
jgi:hypothetical protein